jgi:hypothetical protein
MIKNISGAVIISAISVLVLASCSKQQNASVTNGLTAMDAASVSKVASEIPDTLKVPEGNRMVSDGYATGFQIYQVKRSATDPNVFSWVNIAPLATLFEKPDFTQPMALHFAGPSWLLTKGPDKGQRVVGKRAVGITVDATAVQWLLLQAVDSLSSANNTITFIQRLSTVGGLAPTSGADEAHLGKLDSIPYTAHYLFYVAKH